MWEKYDKLKKQLNEKKKELNENLYEFDKIKATNTTMKKIVVSLTKTHVQ